MLAFLCALTNIDDFCIILILANDNNFYAKTRFQKNL